MTHFLEVNDLSIRAGGLQLAIPHLRLDQGETHCLIGRSGSGKSLIASALAGLHITGIESTGHVLLDGKLTGPQLWKRDVFLLSQEPSLTLDPTMPVGKQISEVFRWRRADDCAWDDADTLALNVGLTRADLRKMPTALSGGMQRRVAIAMALAAKAVFVIADEPTKGLDTDNKNRVIALFKKLQNLGRGLLVITHDLEVVRALADSVSVIDSGHIVEQGSAASILENPQSSAAQSLIENEPARWPIETESSESEQNHVVELFAIGFGYSAQQPLIKNVSLEIRRSEIVGLLGPSGAGKSTLGDLSLGLGLPNAGSVSWHGTPVTRHLAKRKRSRFQKLFQNPVIAFPPHLKLAIVFERLTPISPSAPRLADLLQALELDEDLLDRRPSQISGGELQRMAIARMLMGQPEYIVCDEPSSRLDTSVQRQVLDVIFTYVRNQAAGALLISHNLEILQKRADRIFELTKAGKLIELQN